MRPASNAVDDVTAPATVLFAIMVAHALLETARDSLFLARLGPDELAWVYLAMAGFGLAAFWGIRRRGALRDPRRMLVTFLGFAAAGSAVLAVVVGKSSAAVFVLYVWTGMIVTLVVPLLWTVLDRSLRVAEAKRVFARIGAGGVLGAMVGSAIAGALGRFVTAPRLVAVGAVAYALAAVCAARAAPRPVVDASATLRPQPEESSRRSRRYLWVLVGLGVVSTIALTLGDLAFKRVVAEHLAASDLTTTFGIIYTALNAISLAVQLIVTPRLLARWGVGGALMVLPVMLAMSAMGFALTGAVAAVVVLKLGDGGLRYSLHRVGSEILYLPMLSSLRDGWKPVADAIGLRGGEAAAAVLVFAIGALGSHARVVAGVAALTAIFWLVGIVIARRAYVAQFRDSLRDGEILRDVTMPELDAESIEMLSTAVSSPDDAEAIAALDLLAWRNRLPARVLYHPSKPVVRHALALFEGELRPDVAHVLGDLHDHADPRVRAAALAALPRGASRDRVVAALADVHAEIRAVALVAAADDAALGQRVADGIAVLARGSIADRVALARALELAPSERFRALLHDLLSSHDPECAHHVLRAFARAPSLADLDRLILLLDDPRVRADVRAVFVAAGRRGLARLIAGLDDPRLPLGVRRHLPRTISRFHSPAAAAALVARLLRESDATVEFKILRALGRMRADDPSLAIELDAMREYAHREIAAAARYATLRDCLDDGTARTPGAALIAEMLDDGRRAAVGRAFRALGIAEPRLGLRSVYDAFVGTDDARRSAAREIVETVVPGELRGPLLAVVDDLEPDDRRARLGELAAGPFMTYEVFIATLLADRNESLRCVVAYHVAERGMVNLRSELVRLKPVAGPALAIAAFEQAIARLDA